MMCTKLLLGFATILCFSLGCDPDKGPETPPIDQDFTCIKLFDEVGQDMGIHGSCTTTSDWGKIALNATEKAFLNFSDTISLNGTINTSFTGVGIAPNPVTIGQVLYLYTLGTASNPNIKVKIAIVDESLNIIQQVAVRFQGNNGIAIQMDPAKYASGKYYRMYYQLSATGAPSLLEGYGNFLVCKTFIDGVNTTIESDCL